LYRYDITPAVQPSGFPARLAKLASDKHFQSMTSMLSTFCDVYEEFSGSASTQQQLR
jgi:hypothetical protein